MGYIQGREKGGPSQTNNLMEETPAMVCPWLDCNSDSPRQGAQAKWSQYDRRAECVFAGLVDP
jgi:hypothetical protein